MGIWESGNWDVGISGYRDTGMLAYWDMGIFGLSGYWNLGYGNIGISGHWDHSLPAGRAGSDAPAPCPAQGRKQLLPPAQGYF